MKIRILQNKEIDRDKWESCVGESLNCCVYAHSWYLDLACKSWEALVLDDYDAVMPVFRNHEGKAILPFGVSWVGVYSHNLLDDELCSNFVDALDNNYSSVDLVFDSYFVPKINCGRGMFSSHTLYHLDTISSSLKLLQPSNDWEVIDFDPVKTKNVSLGLSPYDIKIDSSTKMRMQTLATVSLRYKFGNVVAAINNNLGIRAMCIVTYSNGYIFIPFMGISGQASVDSIYVMMLNTLIVNHFEGRPGTLIIDPSKSGISNSDLTAIGASKFSTCHYQRNTLTKFMKFFHIESKYKPSNILSTK